MRTVSLLKEVKLVIFYFTACHDAKFISIMKISQITFSSLFSIYVWATLHLLCEYFSILIISFNWAAVDAFQGFKIRICMYLCIKKVHLFNTQLIQGDGVERMFLGGSNGRQRSSIWGVSDQTDSKWTAKLSASWRWTCSCTESPKAVTSCIRISRED